MVNPKNLYADQDSGAPKNPDLPEVSPTGEAPEQEVDVKKLEKKLIQEQREQNLPKRKPNVSGIAYGIVNTVNNIGLSLFPILFGTINTPPSKESYTNSVIVLIIQSAVGFTFCVWIYIRDMKGAKFLHLPERENLTNHIEFAEENEASVHKD